MRHEIGHDMIAKGEVDINAVREKLVEIVGDKELVDEIASLYAQAYAKTGLNENEIWEECICDSLGDMNIFGYGKEAAELMKQAIPDIQKAVKETKKESNQTRGSPESEGKASRDSYNEYENFAEDKYYQRQIDKIDELKQGAYITVGEIKNGSPLNKVGFPNTVVYFDVSKIVKEMATRADVVPPNIMKLIPKVLDHPIVITEFVDRNGMHSANVYGHLYIGRSPVVVGIMMSQTQKGSIISKIQTVHPNRNALKEMTDDKILYLSENKKETKAWFQSLGTQTLPLGGNKFGFIRSISQSDALVNTASKKSLEKASRELDLITYMDEEAIREGLEMDESKAPTDRERLANALESITENEIEKNKLKEYKAKIEKMNAETEKLAQHRK